MLFHFMF